MKGDLLTSATRALREQHGGASAAALETERRILSRVRQQSQRRFRWLLPAVAVLAASTAAASAGRLFPRLAGLTESWFQTPTQAPSPPRSAKVTKAPGVATETSALPGLPPGPPRVDSPKAVAPNHAPKAAARALSGSPPPAPTPTPVVASPPSAEELYRAAHRLHFVEKNPQGALEAWDRYLQAAPRGALVLEARYNRALALARLGRNAEAVIALQAFARGEYGPYRQAEAQALITKLVP